ncbi:hypothetical protein CDEF62S_00070 [Castellaniella defragrans]
MPGGAVVGGEQQPAPLHRPRGRGKRRARAKARALRERPVERRGEHRAVERHVGLAARRLPEHAQVQRHGERHRVAAVGGERRARGGDRHRLRIVAHVARGLAAGDDGVRIDVARQIEGVAAQAPHKGGDHPGPGGEDVQVIVAFAGIEIHALDVAIARVQARAPDAFLRHREAVGLFRAQHREGVQARPAVDGHGRILDIIAAAVGVHLRLLEGVDHELVIGVPAHERQGRRIAVDPEDVLGVLRAVDRGGEARAAREPPIGGPHRVDGIAGGHGRRQAGIGKELPHLEDARRGLCRAIGLQPRAAIDGEARPRIVQIEVVGPAHGVQAHAARLRAVVVHPLHRILVAARPVGGEQRHEVLAHEVRLVLRIAVEDQVVGARQVLVACRIGVGDRNEEGDRIRVEVHHRGVVARPAVHGDLIRGPRHRLAHELRQLVEHDEIVARPAINRDLARERVRREVDVVIVAHRACRRPPGHRQASEERDVHNAHRVVAVAGIEGSPALDGGIQHIDDVVARAGINREVTVHGGRLDGDVIHPGTGGDGRVAAHRRIRDRDRIAIVARRDGGVLADRGIRDRHGIDAITRVDQQIAVHGRAQQHDLIVTGPALNRGVATHGCISRGNRVVALSGIDQQVADHRRGVDQDGVVTGPGHDRRIRADVGIRQGDRVVAVSATDGQAPGDRGARQGHGVAAVQRIDRGIRVDRERVQADGIVGAAGGNRQRASGHARIHGS